MILHALAFILAAVPADASTLSVKVVAVDFTYPYFGKGGNTCQRGSVYVRGFVDARDGSPRTSVVVRLVDSAGLTAGKEAVLEDVRRAGTGRDGTPVYCAAGIKGRAPAVQPMATVEPSQPPLVPVQAADAAVDTSPEPSAQTATESRCTSRLFNIVKKPLTENKFGPSEFDPESALSVPEAVDCGLARSRVTNALLVRLVKDGFPKPEAVVGAEWGGTWQRADAAPQRRIVKVYLAEPPAERAQR